MKHRDEVLQVLRQNKARLQERYKVSRLSLFGSYARAEQTEASDVDILVEVDPSIGLEFVTLADEIEGLLGIRVGMVSHRALTPRDRQYIERDLIDV